MRLIYKDYTLDETVIDTVSGKVQKYLQKLNMESRSIQRIRLTVEEILLNVLAHCGSGVRISVGIGKQFGRHTFRLRYKAEPFDPTKRSENPLADEMMRSLGVYPAWNCRGRSNTVSLVLADRPKRSTLFYILLAASLAAALGLIGNMMPEDLRLAINDSLISPIADCFLGLLNTFAGVMILLTICSGILGMGDSATLGRTGKSVVARFIGISFAVSTITAVAILPFLKLNFSSGASEQGSAFDKICRMFFDVLPTNIVDPFRTGNTFHIIVIATMIGCALLAVGERGRRVCDLINDFAILFQQIVSSVCAWIPVFVFSMLLQMIWSGKIGVLTSVLKPLLLNCVLTPILLVSAWLITSFRLQCPPILLLKKVFPAFLVALSTASSMSAFHIGMETCEKKLGVNKNLTAFVYPLGSVLYMPSSVLYFTMIVFLFAETYQIAVSIPWIVMTIIMATLITIAMPPIPGADILCYTALFSSLGIPAEAIVLAAAAGVALDYIDTGTNVTLLIFRIACDAKRLDDLDREILLCE